MQEKMEQHQIFIYGCAIVAGVIWGIGHVGGFLFLEAALPVLLALLMCAMFLQIPLRENMFRQMHYRFIIALCVAQFIAIPLFVFGLIYLFQITATPLLIGLCFVLLTPCIDYVIVFTQLGKGDATQMLYATPLLLLLQFVLLPIYMMLFIRSDILQQLDMTPMLMAFLWMIVVPLIGAWLLQWLGGRLKAIQTSLTYTAWLPVPLMALVLFVVIAVQVPKMLMDVALVWMVVPVYVVYHFVAPIIGRYIARCFKLNKRDTRTMMFSTGTRNALVILPLALALPGSWGTVASIVVVTQTCIELISQLAYMRIIPKWIK